MICSLRRMVRIKMPRTLSKLQNPSSWRSHNNYHEKGKEGTHHKKGGQELKIRRFYECWKLFFRVLVISPAATKLAVRSPEHIFRGKRDAVRQAKWTWFQQVLSYSRLARCAMENIFRFFSQLVARNATMAPSMDTWSPDNILCDSDLKPFEGPIQIAWALESL